MALCPRCGAQIQEGLTRCMSCGASSASTYAASTLVADPIQPTVEVPAEHRYFPVATHKFVVLSLFTLGLYDLYWCYRQWHRIRARTGEKISPFWRAVFAPLWGFSLFRVIREDAQSRGINVTWKAGLLGTLYLLLCAAWRLPDPIWLISLSSFVAIIPVVQTVQGLHATGAAAEGFNDSYSGANIITIVIGGLLLLFAIIGTFIPA